MIIGILYVVFGFYSIFVFLSLAGKVWRSRRFAGLRKEMFFSNAENHILKRCVPLFLVLGLIMPLADFCEVLNTTIPEGTYTVEAVASIGDDKNKYILPLSIYYFEDYESETDYNSEPLFLGNYSKNVEITRSFRFCDTQEINLYFDGFVPEYFDSLPDEICSRESFRTSIAGSIIGDDDLSYGYLNCTITMPSFTHENLGLTAEALLESISLWGYIEHISLTLISLFNLLIYICGKD